ncbi:prohead protease/major capsid protein fusion protein [Acidovorax sp. Leaf78]|uniref:prohead protease/major capsid protein fusion protein n=1 Tax=Acidovorax sp. Leaf78 TaxID=1736237 RepID=UPI0006FAD823|nr:prohead protease/major capsid protein fusion protein [Acidovorax sp. Leaf78]KQO23489.1 peptidase [Acidovorax sp. Leaf78]
MPQAAAPNPTTHQRDVRDLPVQVRAATLVPATFNEADNTVEVVWTQGATVRRYDYWEGRPYDEALDVTDEAVDMTRFDAGTVQVLDGHRVYGGVNAILGIAERGWIADGEGRATIRLSQRPEVAGIVADIRAGVIRAISFGYSVQQYAITPGTQRTDGGTIDLYRAVRWMPQEISFVTVPADAGAGTRSAPQASQQQGAQPGGLPCEFVRAAAHPSATQEQRMPQANTQGDGGTADTQQTAANAGDNTANRAAPNSGAAPVVAVVGDGTRAADVLALCQRHGATELAENLLRQNATVDQARAAILDRMDAADQGRRGGSTVSVQTVRDEHDTRMSGMEEAIMSRLDPRAQLTDLGRQYRGLSLTEMAREALEGLGCSTRGLSRNEIATRAFQVRATGYHTTGDFPGLLGGVGARRLRAAYELAPTTFQLWARRAPNLPDFRITNVLAVGGAPELKKLNEAGEYTYGTISEDATSYRAFSYGRAIAMTRQMFVNDDLGAFDRLLQRFGESARRLENRLVYDQITSNPLMQDGVALFHATHGNLLAATSTLTLENMGKVRALMRKQKDLDGKTQLNLAPAYLIVPSDLEQAAYQFTSSNYAPATMADVNEFRAGGRTAVEPIVEPLLDEVSAAAWFMAARSGQIDTVEYAYVDGSEGVRTETFASEDIDGVKVRATLDFAAKVIDWRGLAKANGTS